MLIAVGRNNWSSAPICCEITCEEDLYHHGFKPGEESNLCKWYGLDYTNWEFYDIWDSEKPVSRRPSLLGTVHFLDGSIIENSAELAKRLNLITNQKYW